ncbi:hypothetical protein O3W44_00570 [Pantoea sp. LMR881]|uniref:hypothetical protein n=1 Tax=Pantoea sp. LMR881 TaxID=3014336 RepID=UPI0022AFE480|nr:hypothetical protein [Pantoea sp. LMR881]MCZ4057885.1 hypothetical protein [Pantoea sp. LMR881]
MRYLGGTQETWIVNPTSARTLKIQLIVPVEDMTDIAGSTIDTAAAGSIWPSIESTILEKVMQHRSTLFSIFWC